MRPLWKFLSVGVVCTGLGLSADAQRPRDERPRDGQPPAGERRPPADGPRDRGPDNRGERKADATLESWVKTLAEKITDPHDSIRDSARAGLIAVGQAALPLLRKLADSDDAAKSVAAKKLVAAIERPQQGGPAFAGRGPMPMPGGFTRGGPDTFRPMGDRGPNNPREVRRPEPNDQPRGDRRPEPNNPPGGERRPETDRRPDGERRSGDPLEAAIKGLNLNDQQRKQVGEALEANHKKMAELMEKVRDGKADRTEVRETREGLMMQLKKVLTAEQMQKVGEAMKNAGPMGPPMDRNPRDGGDRPRDNRESR